MMSGVASVVSSVVVRFKVVRWMTCVISNKLSNRCPLVDSEKSSELLKTFCHLPTCLRVYGTMSTPRVYACRLTLPHRLSGIPITCRRGCVTLKVVYGTCMRYVASMDSPELLPLNPPSLILPHFPRQAQADRFDATWPLG